jgi:hypothetical protein
VKGINDSVRDVNRILAGTTILLRRSVLRAYAGNASATAAEEPQEEPAVALSGMFPEPGPGIAEPARPRRSFAACLPRRQPRSWKPRRSLPAETAKKEESSPPLRSLLTGL